MSVRYRPDARQSSKCLRFPQPLHLLFKFGLVDAVLEGLVAVNKYDSHDGKARFLECGANADIGEAVHKGRAVERDASDIDADLRDQFVFGTQIKGRDRHRSSTPSTGNQVTFELNPSCQQMARPRDRSFRNQLADSAAADKRAADSNRRNLDDLELVPELP